MKQEEIKQHLDLVLVEFLNLIEDAQLREDVAKWIYFAGGCLYCLLNDKPVKDYDLWLIDDKLVDKLTALTFWKAKTRNALSYGKFQVITKYTGTPYDIMAEFDFMHNQLYYWPYCNIGMFENFYSRSNELIFNEARARDIERVYIRIDKFVKRGMVISEETKQKIYSRCDQKKLKQERAVYYGGARMRGEDGY